MRGIRTHGITTYAHRDYSDNGPALIISKSEAKANIDKFNLLYKSGKISADQREQYTAIMARRVVPS